MITKVTGERAVFIPDVHVPYHDGEAVGCAFEFIKDFKPHHVFIIGDFIDMYQVSKFNADPRRKLTLQDDLFEAQELLKKIVKITPGSKRYYLRGNHELRLRNFLWSKAAELSGLECLEVPKLLDLEKIGFNYVEPGWMLWHGIMVKHGNLVRKHAGYTALAELMENNMSGVSGHTHRTAEVTKRYQLGVLKWLEIGCLCKLNPEYREERIADWMHGIGFAYVKDKGELFELSVNNIVNGKMLFGNKQFSR